MQTIWIIVLIVLALLVILLAVDVVAFFFVRNRMTISNPVALTLIGFNVGFFVLGVAILIFALVAPATITSQVVAMVPVQRNAEQTQLVPVKPKPATYAVVQQSGVQSMPVTRSVPVTIQGVPSTAYATSVADLNSQNLRIVQMPVLMPITEQSSPFE